MTRQSIQYFLFAILTLSLIGCASSGNDAIKDEDSESIAQYITKGKTTKSQVRRLYGEPNNVSFVSNGMETWEYIYQHESENVSNYIPLVKHIASGSDVATKELVVVFDERDVVKNYSMLINEQEINEYFGGLGRTSRAKNQAKNAALSNVLPEQETPGVAGMAEVAGTLKK